MKMKEMNLAKVAITKRADESVSGALQRINEGFEGGRVSKTDFMSWAILRFVSDLDEGGIVEIHREHFNQVAYLDGLVKRLKKTDRESLTEEERSNLRALLDPNSPSGRGRQRARRNEANNCDDKEKLI